MEMRLRVGLILQMNILMRSRFGYWKDNGVRITGKAVYSMIQMFLQMWNAFAEKLDYEVFFGRGSVITGKRELFFPTRIIPSIQNL